MNRVVLTEAVAFPSHLLHCVPNQEYKAYFDALAPDYQLDEIMEIYEEDKLCQFSGNEGPHPELLKWAVSVMEANQASCDDNMADYVPVYEAVAPLIEVL